MKRAAPGEFKDTKEMLRHLNFAKIASMLACVVIGLQRRAGPLFLKSNAHRALCAISLCLLSLTALLPASVLAQQLWFAPGDDLEVKGIISHPDFPKLFEDPSLWPTGLAHVNVFQFRAPYLARKPEESAKYYSFLKAHHIEIAVAMTVMPAETCGQGIEGTLPRKNIADYPRRIKAIAGIDIDFVLMDEPLFYGHDYNGTNACNFSVSDIAKGVADSVAAIRSYHPHAKFILVEPEQVLSGGPAELGEFLDAYKGLVQEYPFSVRFDVLWRKDWRSQLPPFIAMLKARNIPYGVIFNGLGNIKEDHAWVANAEENARAFVASIHAKPDHIVIQTWQPYPVRNVPESDPDTMTGYLKLFIEHGGVASTAQNNGPGAWPLPHAPERAAVH
jgi:hypothetical protein